MEALASHWDETLAAIPNVGRALPPQEDGLDPDVLYDLALLMSGNDHEAQSLIRSSLHDGNWHASLKTDRCDSLYRLLVLAYLRRNRSLSWRLIHLANRLLSRLWWHGKKSMTPLLDLEAVLDELRPEERVCLILRERLGLSVVEIARITELGFQRTSLALFMARERLRVCLPTNRR